MATILKGTHQLVVDDVVYDLEEMVEEYKAKANGNSRITDAKFRINTQTDNPQEMLDDVAAWLGYMKIVKLEFSNWYAGEVEKSEKEKFVVGNFNGSPIELEYHMDFSTHWHVNSEVADYFVGKTFGEI